MPGNILNRSSYLSKNIGDFPSSMQIDSLTYVKVDDLRYGTNPHQSAAFFKPENTACSISDMIMLKNGKNGLSQTNLEDISFALSICKFFSGEIACAVMKHVNPSGAAVANSAKNAYINARDADPRAAFGSTIAFNTEVDAETATEIMSSFVECVVAPAISDEALDIFNDCEKFKLNKHIRVLKCGTLDSLPKFVGDAQLHHLSYKTLIDGSIVVAEPLLTNLKSIDQIKPAEAENKACGHVISTLQASEQQTKDLLTAWYINLNVRSNGVVIVKNGATISVGTGEQDRVGAVEQAISKYNNKYEGDEVIEDSVMASDGFFPFPDAVEVAAAAGITAIIAPSGSLKDADVIKRANELKVALVHAPERCFSHH